LYAEVRAAKLAERSVHMMIAGGRRTLTVFGMATAQLLFDENDYLWHLSSQPELEASGRLHAGPDEWARLIPIPVVLWGRLSPVFEQLSTVADPFEATEHLRQYRLREKWDAARTFVLGSLSGAEQRVVELLAREGLTDAEMAARLSIISMAASRLLVISGSTTSRSMSLSACASPRACEPNRMSRNGWKRNTMRSVRAGM
jgi:hypothetical protein